MNKKNTPEYRQLQYLISLREKIKERLPFLYIFDERIFSWQREFFSSKNRVRLLCAANQIGKSTTAIRYALIVATHPDGYKKYGIPSWEELWGSRLKKITIWYFYPDEETQTTEFREKWSQLLPSQEFTKSNHPQFGYKIEKKKSKTFALHFNTGASIYFKTYSQPVKNLQSTSVHLLIADEEMPHALYSELSARLFATKGYFVMVFTATLGQEIWRRAMEEIGTDKETFVSAWKKTISMYDCMYYEDGTQRMTKEDIEEVKALCATEEEIQRRVYGRFVYTDVEKVFTFFDKSRHVIKPKQLKGTWYYYVGIDIGSGGKNHKSAISVVAVSKDFDLAYVVDFWRGDMETSLVDVAEQLEKMIKKHKPVGIFYDYAAKDFYSVCANRGISIVKADKDRNKGIGLINTLFKKDMLFIYDIQEHWKLIDELEKLDVKTDKRHAKDDGVDSLRYAISMVPFNFNMRDEQIQEKKDDNPERYNIITTRGLYEDTWDNQETQKKNIKIEEEFSEWNEYYEV